MNKSLLVSSFAVLTASVFGMNQNYQGESFRGNNHNQLLRKIRPAPIPYNGLLKAYNWSWQLCAERSKQVVCLNQRLQTLQKEKDNLESFLREKIDEIDDLKDKIEKEILAKKMNAEKIEERDKQIKKIQGEKEKLESLFQEKDKQIEELTKQHEMVSLSRRVNEEEIEKLTEHLDNLQERKEELKKKLEESRNNEAKLTEEIERLNQKIERSREKRRKLTAESEEKNADIERFREQVVDLEQQLEQIKRNEQKVQQENEKLKEKISELKQQLLQTRSENFADKYQFTHIKSISSRNKTDGNKALYRQSYYNALKNDVSVGHETPTTILVRANGHPEKLESILEIRYANDVSHKKLDNPKAIFYRSNKNECYIVLKIDNKDYSVVYGLKERITKVGKGKKKSFFDYEISKDMKSFTDDVFRLVYVDHSGLYIVPGEENSIDQVRKVYKENGQFNFKGSIIKVSAIDGSLTLNNERITKDNFFDNGDERGSQTILSTKQPNHREILRNFYSPTGTYRRIYDSIGPFSSNINWLNSFKNARISGGLVENGDFRKRLMPYLHNEGKKHESFCEALVDQVKARDGKVSEYQNILQVTKENWDLFKDLDFVKKLKPIFAREETNCEPDKKEEFQQLFNIAKNL